MSNNKPDEKKREMEWPGASKKEKTGEMEWPKPGSLCQTNVEAIVRDLPKNAQYLGLWNLDGCY